MLLVNSKDFLQVNLSRLMGEKRLSQRRLAEAAGVSPLTVFRAVSKGVRPRGDNLKKIAQALEVSESALLADPAAPAPALAQSVADMTPAELEALVARASKRDGFINLEVERLKRENQEMREKLKTYATAIEAWDSATEAMRALFQYLAGKDSDLDRVPKAILDPILKKIRSLEIQKRPKDHREDPSK